MRPDASDWDEDDLLEMIALGIQESIELDYKQCDALQKTDGKKNEISKDVSAFANSAGGTLVYGMIEDGHVPIKLDCGFDPEEISKEWLEQVINSRIQRRIDGIRINQVQLVKHAPGRVVYVVSIPQSTRAPHQAADKRFYKRFNYASVPMEEYEIRDVTHRTSAPDLFVQFQFSGDSDSVELTEGKGGYFRSVGLIAKAWNESTTSAPHVVFHFYIDERCHIEEAGQGANLSQSLEKLSTLIDGKKLQQRKLTVLWGDDKNLPLFLGVKVDLPVTPMRISIPVGPNTFILGYTIGAPGMPPKQGVTVIRIKDRLALLEAVGDERTLAELHSKQGA